MIVDFRLTVVKVDRCQQLDDERGHPSAVERLQLDLPSLTVGLLTTGFGGGIDSRSKIGLAFDHQDERTSG